LQKGKRGQAGVNYKLHCTPQSGVLYESTCLRSAYNFWSRVQLFDYI